MNKQLTTKDILFLVIALLLLMFFQSSILLIAIYLSIYPYLLLTGRKNSIKYLLISSGVALIWVLIAKNQYGYNREMLTLFKLNLFPLFAWASGLFGTFLIFSSFSKKIRYFAIFYWFVLILAETVAYHFFNIKNLATAQYEGLPICDCMHAPLWMQMSYFSMGLIYFGVCKLIQQFSP